MAALSLNIASCGFCSSDQRFASTFLQIRGHPRHPWSWLYPSHYQGGFRDFHPLVTCAARRTNKKVATFAATFLCYGTRVKRSKNLLPPTLCYYFRFIQLRKFSMITFSASASVIPRVLSFRSCSSLILPIAAS